MPGRWSLRSTPFGGPRSDPNRLRQPVAAPAVVLTVGLLTAHTASITPAEAKAYAGQVKTVCGKVASVN
jgi:hypothetical protein